MTAPYAESAAPCRQRELLLALGTVSPPEHRVRRVAQRNSWMQWPNVGVRGAAASVCAVFIVRSGGAAPRGLGTQLARERAAYGDMLLVDSIAWNESRVRGPTLSLSWWLDYASRELTHAPFVGKIDDDAYLHAPDLHALLATTLATTGPEASTFVGVLTWYHWYPKLFDYTMHGWTFLSARGAGKHCRAHTLSLEPHTRFCGADGCGK